MGSNIFLSSGVYWSGTLGSRPAKADAGCLWINDAAGTARWIADPGYLGTGRGGALGRGLGVGLGVGARTSKEPISMRLFTTRLNPGPRWS
jgi:hypothetical protein